MDITHKNLTHCTSKTGRVVVRLALFSSYRMPECLREYKSKCGRAWMYFEAYKNFTCMRSHTESFRSLSLSEGVYGKAVKHSDQSRDDTYSLTIHSTWKAFSGWNWCAQPTTLCSFAVYVRTYSSAQSVCQGFYTITYTLLTIKQRAWALHVLLEVLKCTDRFACGAKKTRDSIFLVPFDDP